MKTKLAIGSLIIFLSLLLVSCEKEAVPMDLYTVEEMIPVLKDLQIAYAGVDVTVALQEEKERKYDELNVLVLERHEMDNERFFRSFQWYQSQPEVMDKMYSEVIDILTKELDELQKELANQNRPSLPNQDNNGQTQPTN